MKVTTRAVYKMLPNGSLELLHEESYEYVGPVALAVRSLVNQAQNAATNAGNVGAGYGSQASDASANLTPFYTSEMRSNHLFNPSQMNELLTAAEAGSGGATGAIVGQGQQDVARTRNASGFTKTLDEAARDKAKAAAGSSEGIAAQDVMGAKQLNQAGAAGMQGLYGTDVNAQLKAMGQQSEDINAATQAGQHGWLQNLTGTLGALGADASGAGSIMKAMQGPGAPQQP